MAIGMISSVQRYKIISKKLVFFVKMIFLHCLININKHINAVIVRYVVYVCCGTFGSTMKVATNGSSMNPNSCNVKKYEFLHSLFCCVVNSILFTMSYETRLKMSMHENKPM